MSRVACKNSAGLENGHDGVLAKNICSYSAVLYLVLLLQRNTMEEYLMELILSRGNASSVSSFKALYDHVQLSVLIGILAKQHQIQLVGIE